MIGGIVLVAVNGQGFAILKLDHKVACGMTNAADRVASFNHERLHSASRSGAFRHCRKSLYGYPLVSL